MPAAIPIIVAGVQAGSQIYGAKKQAQANREATRATRQSTQEALDLEKARDQENQRQWEAVYGPGGSEEKAFNAAEQERVFQREQAEYRRQLEEAAEAEREYQRQLVREREARADPYRQASRAALDQLGAFLGLSVPQQAYHASASIGAPGTTPPGQTNLSGDRLSMSQPTSPLSRSATERAFAPVNDPQQLATFLSSRPPSRAVPGRGR